MKTGYLLASAVLLSAAPASAAITWTDWTQSGSGTVVGNAGSVGVIYTGSYGFAQTNGGTDYWHSTYSSSWDGTIAAPTGSDIIGLSGAGTKTISFTSAVSDVYLALMSWNGQTSVTFDKNFTQEGWVRGCGYWGCGLLTNVTSNSFTSVGEAHGILKFAGPITSLTFSDSNDEYWHGIQVGIGASGAVPEPSTWALLILGFGVVGAAMRRRAKAAISFA